MRPGRLIGITQGANPCILGRDPLDHLHPGQAVQLGRPSGHCPCDLRLGDPGRVIQAHKESPQGQCHPGSPGHQDGCQGLKDGVDNLVSPLGLVTEHGLLLGLVRRGALVAGALTCRLDAQCPGVSPDLLQDRHDSPFELAPDTPLFQPGVGISLVVAS